MKIRTMCMFAVLTLLIVNNSWGITFGVGKKGNTYDYVADEINSQLRGSGVTIDKQHFNGSDDIRDAILDNTLDGGVLQLDSLIGKDSGLIILARTHKEYVHLLTKYKGDVKKVGHLIGKKLAIGKIGGGTRITWRNFGALDEKYAKKVGTIAKDGALALAALNSGAVDGILYVGGLRGKDMMRANRQKKTYQLTKINDSQFNNLKVAGEKVYQFESIDDDVYPNLIRGSSVKTLFTHAVVVVSETWVNDNEDEFEKLFEAVQSSLSNIHQKLEND